jgi:hypothetical protein
VALRIGADPDVFVRGRDRDGLDAAEQRAVRDEPAVDADVCEVTAGALTPYPRRAVVDVV